MTVCGEKITGVCVAAKCPHFKRCCPTAWDKYGKIKPKTNEEWLQTATTEQLIEFLEKITDPHVGYLVGYWREWLKQPHTFE